MVGGHQAPLFDEALRTFKDAEAYRRIALLEPLGRAGVAPDQARKLFYGDLFWGPAQDDDAVLPGDVRFAELSRTLKIERIARAVDSGTK